MGLGNWLAGFWNKGNSNIYLTQAGGELVLYSPKEGGIISARDPRALAALAVTKGYTGSMVRVGYKDAPSGLRTALEAKGVSPEIICCPQRKAMGGLVYAMTTHMENAQAAAKKAAAEARAKTVKA